MTDLTSHFCLMCKGRIAVTAQVIDGVVYCPHVVIVPLPADVYDVNPYAGDSQ